MRSFWLIPGVLVLFLVALRMLLLRRGERRLFAALASRLRLNDAPTDVLDVAERFHELALLRRGHGGHAWNLLYGATPAGLVAVFCHAYEAGIGAQRERKAWWIGVVRTGAVHRPWRARMAADHHDAGAGPIDAGIQSFLEGFPGSWQWEVRGPLVAVAAPLDDDPATAERVFNAVLDLAGRLAGGRRAA